MSVAAFRKTVSVLFCDLVGSTVLGEQLDAESYRAVMAEWYESMRVPVERHGGTVEKFIGDAVMAVFGIPQAHEDDALRAVRAALEMRAALEAVSASLEARGLPSLHIRTGINTGEVVTGDGKATLVTGDAVNTAKRLEQAAGPDEILIGAATRRLVANAATLEPVGPIEAKGKRVPVEAWRVLAEIAGASTFARRLDAGFVGRAGELALLRREFATATDQRSCRLVTIIGAAGIGKSRLAAELVDAISEHARVIQARCLAYGDGITFLPLLELFRSAGGDDAIAAAVECEPDRALILERLATLSGDAMPVSPEETFWAVRRLLEALARERPLVVRLDDVHWAEPTLLDLVEYLAGWSHGTPILVICLARPELLEERSTWLNVNGTTVTLAPLSWAESEELLASLDTTLDARARSRISEAAEGNPLFVEQMAAMLVEDRDETAMPATIHALLTARLDRLEPLERQILERASVLGKEFARGGVVELSPPEDRGAVGSTLLALTRRELIEPGRTPVPGDDGFRFRHALIRDAAYSGISKRMRADMHERVGGLIEQQGNADELVGYHYEHAFRFRQELGRLDDGTRALGARASTLLGDAGTRAYAREDMPAAVNLLERALRLADPAEPPELELLRELSAALWWSGDVARSGRLLDELISTAAETGDVRHQWYALVERAARRMLDEDPDGDELLRVAGEAVPVFETLGDDTGLARAWRRIAYAHQMRLQFAASEDASLLALTHARAAHDVQEEERVIDGLCTSLLFGPTPAANAIARCEEILEQARDMPIVQANVSISLAGLLAMLGRFDEARASAGIAEAVYTERGMRLALAGWTQVAGPLELLAGDQTAAEGHLRSGLEIVEDVAGVRGYQQLLLAQALCRRGAYEEAGRLAELGEATTASDLASRVIASGVRATVDAAVNRDRLDGAIAAAREAVALASTTDALNLWGDSLVSLAGVLRSAGRSEDADKALREAADIYGLKGNVVAASQALTGSAARGSLSRLARGD